MHDHLVIMSGHPSASSSLPRLVSALGDRGAARLQQSLLEHAVKVGRSWRALDPQRRLTIGCHGAPAGEFRDWLGDDLEYEGDSGGSPGARMAVASMRVFSQGADRVLLLSVKNPTLELNQLESACFALEHLDCIIGPGHAGRYFLIGLVAPTPALFAGIPWGTGAVLTRTLDAARRADLRVGLLDAAPMIHGPGDLVHAAHLVTAPIGRAPARTVLRARN